MGKIIEVGSRKEKKDLYWDLNLGKTEPDMDTSNPTGQRRTTGKNRGNFQEEEEIKARVLKPV